MTKMQLVSMNKQHCQELQPNAYTSSNHFQSVQYEKEIQEHCISIPWNRSNAISEQRAVLGIRLLSFPLRNTSQRPRHSQDKTKSQTNTLHRHLNRAFSEGWTSQGLPSASLHA